MTESNTLTTTIDNGIWEIELNRPKANAIDLATSRAMGEAFKKFRDDDSLRVAIIRTAGEKFFSGGWDLKAAAGGDAVDGDYGVGGFAGIQELPHLDKPIIAAVEGMAVGGGFELALSADLIYATEQSSFALPEIRAGTLADAATYKLPKRMPYHIAMEMLLLGRWMSANEALRWGIINEALADGATMIARAREVARILADGPPLVFAAIKEVTRESEGSSFLEIMSKIGKRQLRSVDILYSSEDNLEGFTAFAEKRAPVWRGR